MKKVILIPLLLVFVFACSPKNSEEASSSSSNDRDVSVPAQAANKGQASVDSGNNVLMIAINSPDHSTLVAAVQAAGIEHILANNGPFTIFAPTNAAFDALPEGTVENLLKPENKQQLINILYYHASPGIYKDDLLNDGRQIYQANGAYIPISVKDGETFVKDAKILGSVDGTNGVVHVIDKVLVP